MVALGFERLQTSLGDKYQVMGIRDGDSVMRLEGQQVAWPGETQGTLGGRCCQKGLQVEVRPGSPHPPHCSAQRWGMEIPDPLRGRDRTMGRVQPSALSDLPVDVGPGFRMPLTSSRLAISPPPLWTLHPFPLGPPLCVCLTWSLLAFPALSLCLIHSYLVPSGPDLLSPVPFHWT